MHFLIVIHYCLTLADDGWHKLLDLGPVLFFFVCVGVFQWKGFVHWTVCVCAPVPFEIQQLRTKIPNCLCYFYYFFMPYVHNKFAAADPFSAVLDICSYFTVDTRCQSVTVLYSLWSVLTPPSTLCTDNAGSQNTLPQMLHSECLTSMVTNPNWRSSALFSNPFTAETMLTHELLTENKM